ncbi:putative lipoprotein [Enterobacteria phage mEp021]|nr:putative lipoprotein [Enterobacteria phage mEp021]
MKMVTIIAVAAILVGCADTNRHNGHCATSAYGVCYERWVDGAKVPSGEICRVYDGTDGHSGKTRDCGSKEWY